MIVKFQLSFGLDDAQANFNIHKDSVYICGSSKALGSWDLREAVELKSKVADTCGENCSLSLSSLSLSSSSSCEVYLENL